MSQYSVNVSQPIVDLEGKAHAKSSSSSSSSSSSDLGDIICLAYLYILQAVNCMQTSAQLQSKQLEANANAQARVNKEAEDITYVNVPTYKADYDTIRKKHKPKADYDRGLRPAGPNKMSYDYSHSYYTTKRIFKSDNMGQIQADQTTNNQHNKMRDDLSNQIVILRQDAQNQMTQLNTKVDLAEQVCQEGISLTSTLKQLMREALLKR